MSSRVSSKMVDEYAHLPAEISSLMKSIHEKSVERVDNDRRSKDTLDPYTTSSKETHAVFITITKLDRKCDKRVRKVEGLVMLLPTEICERREVVAKGQSFANFLTDMRKRVDKILTPMESHLKRKDVVRVYSKA